MKPFLLITLIISILSCSKTDKIETEQETIDFSSSSIDYNSLNNWAFHPNKTTILSNYNLDIAVIDENLQIEQTIQIPNNSTTNTGIDVFFVHPTVLTQNSTPENIDIEDQSSLLINGTIIAQGGLLSKYGRMFAPRYRQSTGKTYKDDINKELQANIIATSYSDVKAAFLNYLNNYNEGNKIILAGHSQGSYLLAMLLRDLFDNNLDLREKLVNAALGGMAYVYANQETYKGGWWENIPLCTSTDECGCINNWATFDEQQSIIDINYGLPEFNPFLINSGLVYRMFDKSQDWFVQDFSYYGDSFSPLKNYIMPNANYNLGNGTNFIAFDGLYNVRQRREGLQKVVLSIEHNAQVNDQRPNDLENEKNNPNYPNWGYHVKDYHIYLWALMEQIDKKINTCIK
ncbi:DUF3089 domain-containing protein [Thalassobellus sediminis]|uniref:DUF3089 domain-containing protein n=1 Tax=Thalassobellus sediminis TaxID=3367753 RepID=UPI0037B77392